MTMSDPISDMLARIRNGQQAKKEFVKVPSSKVKRAICQVLADEGYITGFTEDKNDKGFQELSVELKYYEGKPVISEMSRVSRPGLRQYSKSTDIPSVRDGLGVTVVTTSKGVMSDAQARAQKLGGELLFRVF